MRSYERLTVVAAVLLSAITAATRPEGGALRLTIFLGIAGTTWLLTRVPPGRVVGFLRDWFPVACVLTIYLLLQPVIEAVAPWRLDPWLAEVDARYFAGVVTAWRNAFGRPVVFTDAIYLAYVSYYLLPITVAAMARIRGPARFERTAYTLLVGFYLTYLAYLVMPASGPRLPEHDEVDRLGGGAISDAVRAFLHAAESTTLDAFPSGHTTVAVIAGVLGSRLLSPGGATAIWTWSAGIVFATVYINVHYVVDVVAGLALAAMVLAICPWPARFSAGGVAADSA